jgi:(R,R)-butanediol dehydrogenase / meso-butanediol dehydrogenase / diacetyl reductase
VRALRFHASGDLRVDEVPAPVAAPGTVTVRVTACGICGSDVHEYRDGPHVIPPSGAPHPLTGETVPVTLGHEIAGTVVALGEGVDADRLRPGLDVVVDPLLACGRCAPCRRGRRHLCVVGGALGLIGGGGGFAELVAVPAANVHPLPPELDPAVAALTEPIAVGWHALRRARFRPGQTVLVVGAGPVGLGGLASARAGGARTAAVVVRRPGVRADVAAALGAHAVVRGPDAAAEVEPDGFDVVLETGGTPAALRTALAAVRPGGVVVDVALWGERAELNLNKLLAREIALVGSMGYAGEFPAVLAAMVDGRLGDVGRMVTARVPLDDAVDRGFAVLAADRTAHVKVLVEP